MAGHGEWNESLCGCFDDLGSCCYGFWCTSCLFGSNAEKIDGSSCIGMCCLWEILCLCDLCWIPHMMKRGDLRRKYNLRPDPCDDCPTTFFCGPCALCQEARFLARQAGRPGVIVGHVVPGPIVINQPRMHY